MPSKALSARISSVWRKAKNVGFLPGYVADVDALLASEKV